MLPMLKKVSSFTGLSANTEKALRFVLDSLYNKYISFIQNKTFHQMMQCDYGCMLVK